MNTIINYSNSFTLWKGKLPMLQAIALVAAILGVTGCAPPHPH